MIVRSVSACVYCIYVICCMRNAGFELSFSVCDGVQPFCINVVDVATTLEHSAFSITICISYAFENFRGDGMGAVCVCVRLGRIVFLEKSHTNFRNFLPLEF